LKRLAVLSASPSTRPINALLTPRTEVRKRGGEEGIDHLCGEIGKEADQP